MLLVRPKSAIYTPKQDDEYSCHFYSWFSRYVIAAMLVEGKQKIAH